MGDYGLISLLWENEALPLISSFIPMLDQKDPEIYRELPINHPSGRYVSFSTDNVLFLMLLDQVWNYSSR